MYFFKEKKKHTWAQDASSRAPVAHLPVSIVVGRCGAHLHPSWCIANAATDAATAVSVVGRVKVDWAVRDGVVAVVGHVEVAVSGRRRCSLQILIISRGKNGYKNIPARSRMWVNAVVFHSSSYRVLKTKNKRLFRMNIYILKTYLPPRSFVIRHKGTKNKYKRLKKEEKKNLPAEAQTIAWTPFPSFIIPVSQMFKSSCMALKQL